jgi:hypothetical protein
MVTKKVIPIKQITSWSFSRYSDYKQCPLKCKLKHVDRIKEPGSDALNRGAAIHDLAEKYIKGLVKTRVFPVELKLFEALFKMLKAQYKKKINGMVVEDNWAFTKNWTETQWDNWVQCWVRIKLDCAHHQDLETLIITDWKTGKFRVEMNEDYVEQLELYALAALLLHPHIEKVMPRLVYLDQGTIYPKKPEDVLFTRADITMLKKKWEKRVKAMLSDKIFAPRPNDKCKWCWYGQSGKAKGGPGLCKY